MPNLRYVKGDALKKAVADLGSVDVIWAEMGNTQLGTFTSIVFPEALLTSDTREP